ncbi:DUF397 domain-containing protein [Streptomyces sp. NPDC093510]|uniref:DUF397 domain-containing protein n=1 Tax=Streptomyces sp. NPDC093510 TaxID=3155199 RepID=UPI003438B842
MSLTAWQKSTFSGGGDGNACVDLTRTDAYIHLRESDDPGVELTTPPATLDQLLRTIKANQQ